MPVAIILLESGWGRILCVNRKACELLGLEHPSPLTGAAWSALAGVLQMFHVDGRPYRLDESPVARAILDGETIADEEIDLLRGDGEIRTLLVGAAPVRSPADGEVTLDGVVITFSDITAPRRATHNLRSEERLQLLIESTIDYAIFTTDTAGRITSWNTGAERLIGWTEAEALGRLAADVFTPEDRAKGEPEKEMRTAAEHGCAEDERWHMRKDGSRFWASGSLTAVRDARGHLVEYAKIMRDHTERREAQKRVEEALRLSESMRAAAEQANLAKDEFVATVSHELRTPLNTIRLWSKMLGSGKLPHDDWPEGVRMIERAALAQQQLIADLLDVSRIATGQLRLNVRPTPLAAAIEGAIEAVRPMAAARTVQLQWHVDQSVGVVRADPERVQQVVWNLLVNAIKFTPAHGRIDLAATRHGDEVEVRVADTGIGISDKFLPFVFERFRQAERVTVRTHSGLGLGLAIAKQLVELHGGTITAASDGEGRGAVFTVRWPMPRLRESEEGIVGASAESAQARFAGLRVLLVEDDPPARKATQRLLELHGASVALAETATAAWEAYAAARPDLVVCDIGLPGEDGLSLVRRLRAAETARRAPRVPVIALTAFAREEDKKTALAAGFDRHLAKPVDPDLLLATIAEVVVGVLAGR